MSGEVSETGGFEESRVRRGPVIEPARLRELVELGFGQGTDGDGVLPIPFHAGGWPGDRIALDKLRPEAGDLPHSLPGEDQEPDNLPVSTPTLSGVVSRKWWKIRKVA